MDTAASAQAALSQLLFAALVLASVQLTQPLTNVARQVPSWLGISVITSLGFASLIFFILNPLLVAAMFGQF